MIIDICSRFNVLRRVSTILSRGYKVAVISISDRNKDNPDFYMIPHVLKLKFDDVVDGEGSMTESDAEVIHNFVDHMKLHVDVLIVHCEAGISRSAGVAAAIMKYLIGDDQYIFDNPIYCPNMTCYRLLINEFSVETDENEIINKENSNFMLRIKKFFKLSNLRSILHEKFAKYRMRPKQRL